MDPLREDRPWLPRYLALLFGLPLFLVLSALYSIRNQPREIIPGAPLLLLMGYSMLVIMTGRTRREVDHHGFRVSYGPLPCGARSSQHPQAAVRAIFPRHLREGVGRGLWEDHYYAAVELTGGQWINVLGHYPAWAGASEACARLAHLWARPQVAAGRSGFPAAYRDRDGLRVVWIWGSAYLAAFAWAIGSSLRMGLM